MDYGLVGAAGYVAPRHMRAIRDTGGELKAALDTQDSVGVIDSFFPDARFFTEFERFDRHVDKLRRRGNALNYLSICSPNYLHDAHIRFALRSGCDAICEKPLVLNPRNIDGLEELERDTGGSVNTILQLRLHPAIIALRERLVVESKDIVHDVNLTYITSRGRWYYVSWKGDETKSGGIATNIGVHFFDMLGFLFGDLKETVVHHRSMDCAGGYLRYERARVRWFLSINANDLPEGIPEDSRTFRSITMDNDEIEFSGGFNDLHTRSYEAILAGNGFKLSDVRPCIETVANIRNMEIKSSAGHSHPFLDRVKLQEGRYNDGWPT